MFTLPFFTVVSSPGLRSVHTLQSRDCMPFKSTSLKSIHKTQCFSQSRATKTMLCVQHIKSCCVQVQSGSRPSSVPTVASLLFCPTQTKTWRFCQWLFIKNLMENNRSLIFCQKISNIKGCWYLFFLVTAIRCQPLQI